MVRLAIVGRSAHPQVSKDIIHQLPVHYYNCKKAWINLLIFSNWFYTHFIPAISIRKTSLTIPADDVKVLLILDSTPAHPNVDKAVSSDGSSRRMYLPPNVALLIQPMDQGVILYHAKDYTTGGS